MEQLEIHSKSYLIRWVHVPGGHSISWSIQPHKKGLNFGIFRHPGTANSLTPSLSATTANDASVAPDPEQAGRSRRNSTAGSTVVEKLAQKGLKCVAWIGKCEADKVSLGKHDVPEGESGMYGLCFDNTFSKQFSKTATFVSMTYPTKTPPKSGHHLHFPQAMAQASGSNCDGRNSPWMAPTNPSTESLRHDSVSSQTVLDDPRPRGRHALESEASLGTFFTGILWKKRRRRNQGYARRFFSLDYTSCTLSYYRNRHSSALRGAVPLSLAVIGTNDKSREISVDSGAELWHLKAHDRRDFEAWRDALERASRGPLSMPSAGQDSGPTDPPISLGSISNPAEEREWARVEALVGRISGTRDAVRRLARDTDPKYLPSYLGLGVQDSSPNGIPSPTESVHDEYFKEGDGELQRISRLWKRKPTSGSVSPSGFFRRAASAQHVPSRSTPVSNPLSTNGASKVAKPPQIKVEHEVEPSMHEHCMELLHDLDQTLAEFSVLITENRQRRATMPRLQPPRSSIDSRYSQEFFDAEEGSVPRSQLVTISRDSDDREHPDHDVRSVDSATSSSIEDQLGPLQQDVSKGGSFYPAKAESLYPLPTHFVARRKIIPPTTVPPPSLIGFLRKNIGKDLSTIAMPVSANEPLSLLQRTAENMEYSTLLDSASNLMEAKTIDAGIARLLYITAFAVSPLSNCRVKERAVRKPFNPMLGETFELVREDLGFRFLAEKVSHRPVRIAYQAESDKWTYAQSPLPMQKFWGKSAELNTEGLARLTLFGRDGSSENYSWHAPTCFLRNIIAGEKYIEPVQAMSVLQESTGLKAVVEFKAKGIFAGRSEDVVVKIISPTGAELGTGLAGRWTSNLNVTGTSVDSLSAGKDVWTAGDLVDKAQTRYGFTTFAATLNEITPLEDSHLPVTDSRMRPDQRAHEENDLDRAEALKARLEERQRARRKVLEDHGKEWTPRWFAKVAETEDGEEVWRMKTGKDGYWSRRKEKRWDDVAPVFET